MIQDTGWDHALKVTGNGAGLVGHAGAVLLRKLADRAGLTVALGPALARAGKSPLVDRGIALVSMAVAIVLGAASMSDITLLAHQEPVFGDAPSDTTVRRTLELADPRTLPSPGSPVTTWASSWPNWPARGRRAGNLPSASGGVLTVCAPAEPAAATNWCSPTGCWSRWRCCGCRSRTPHWQ